MTDVAEVTNEELESPEAEGSEPGAGGSEGEAPTPEPDTPDAPDGDGDGDEEAEAELAEEPREPEQAHSSVDIDKALAKIGKRAGTFVAFVADTLGEDAIALVQCELCHPQIPGWHFTDEFMQANRMQLPDLQARLFEVLRTPVEPNYNALSGFTVCMACGGEGKGTTGSKVPQHRLTTCPTCQGRGFIPPQGAQVVTEFPTATNGVVSLSPESVPPLDEVDPWGSPRLLPDGRENPNYGKIIHFKDPAFP